MPNWCVNSIEISGDDATLRQLAEAVRGNSEPSGEDKTAFSFYEIKKPPLEDPIYHGEPSQNSFVCGCSPTFDKSLKDDDFPNGKWVVNGKPIQRSTDLVEGSFASENGFGVERCPEHAAIRISDHPNFFWNWNIANWGTKWSAHDVYSSYDDTGEIAGKITYGFDTAWSPPLQITEILSGQFPTLTFEHYYCEGGMGYAGVARFKAGAPTDTEEYDASELSDDAWQKDDNGKPMYGDRDYDKVPMNRYESFCEEHFGGVVGG